MVDGDMDGQVGQTVGGSYDTVTIRQHQDGDLRPGDLLACNTHDGTILLRVRNTETGSQLGERARERLSGTMMAGPSDVGFYEPEFSYYTLAQAKPVYTISGTERGMPKMVIDAFTPVRRATPEDLAFMGGPGPGRLYLGRVRSGYTTMPGDGLWMDARGAITHHMLVVAPAGRGKSNLIKCMLWEVLGTGGAGMLVFDERRECRPGLSEHPNARDSLACYTLPCSPQPGAIPMSVSVRSVLPDHISGMVELSEAEEQVMYRTYRTHKDRWIEQLEADMQGDGDGGRRGAAPARAALYRKVRRALGLGRSGGVFSVEGVVGERTIRDIVDLLNAGGVVVVETSGMGESEERAVRSILVDAVLRGRWLARSDGRLDGLPPVGIVIDEAQTLLADAGNPYSDIMLNGRKLRVGLVAVSQLALPIPPDVLMGLGTKVILGSATPRERDAIAESAAQDLSGDRHAMGSLGVGEAIVSSVLIPFAVVTKIPPFDDLARNGRGAGRPERPG